MHPARADPADLTSRARIRDAALELFTERGVDGTSIRDVARAAGVSPGSVQHHFGTKAGLRAACDEHVLRQLVDAKEQLLRDHRLGDPGSLAAAQPELLGLTRYLARSTIDGSPGAAAMFEQLVDATEHWLVEHRPGMVDDVRSYAALLVAMETGLLAMHGPLSAVLGVDVLSPDGILYLARARLAFYSTPLLDETTAREGRDAVEAILAARRAP